jgi:hypothetical protein
MLHHVRAFIIVITLSALAGGAAQAQTGTAFLTGEATDASGAALPGVTVTIFSSTLPARSLVTDGVGRFGFDALPEGVYEVGFELSGFEPARYAQVRVRGGESVVLNQRMRMAALTETVMVFGSAPPELPPPPPFIPPTPSVVPVPAEALASVCGPSHLSGAAPVARVAAHRDERGRRLFGHGDQVILDAGLEAGLAVGTNVVVRRTFHAGQRDRLGRTVPVGEHGAGLLQIVEALEHSAVAAVVYACDEFSAGDYVERFDPQPMWHAKPYGTPDFSTAGRVLFGDEGQVVGSPQQLMVIDLGGNHGLEAGQWITVFRRIGDVPGPVSQVGRAVVISVKPTSSTIRIESARDAVVAGDLVARHR